MRERTFFTQVGKRTCVRGRGYFLVKKILLSASGRYFVCSCMRRGACRICMRDMAWGREMKRDVTCLVNRHQPAPLSKLSTSIKIVKWPGHACFHCKCSVVCQNRARILTMLDAQDNRWLGLRVLPHLSVCSHSKVRVHQISIKRIQCILANL